MTKKEATVVCIKPIIKKTAKIRIIGDSPLIVHAWSEKAKKELLASQQGTKLKKDKKQAKNVYGEIAEALYWMNGKPDVAYVNVTVVAPDEPPVRSYMPMKEVLEHPDLHSQMMADAFRDAQSFKQKYNTLERLKPVMDAMDKAFDGAV